MTSRQASTEARNAIKTGRVQEGIKIWYSLFDYEAKRDDELSLTKGTQVEVLTKDPKISGTDGWWTGKIKDEDKVGVFPSNFVAAQATPPKPTIVEIDYKDLKLGDIIGRLL